MKRFLVLTSLILVTLLVAGIALAEETGVTSMTLEQALAYAEANSLQLQVAQQDLKTAETQVLQAGASYFPELNVALTGSTIPNAPSYDALDIATAAHIGLTLPPLPDPNLGFNTTVSINQPLYNAPIYIQYQLAKKNYQIAQLDYDQARTDLTFNVANAFFGVCKAKEGIETAKGSLQLAEQNLKMVKANFDAGITVKTDVLKMELNVSNARQGLLAAENGYRNALAGFKQLISYPQDKNLQITSPEALPSFKFAETATSFESRYDWKKSNFRIELADLGIKMANAGYLPTAFASYSYSASKYDSPTLSGGDSVITVGLKWNFSFGGKTKAAVKEAEIALQKAQLGLEATKQNTATEVLQCQLSYNEAQQRMEIVTLALKYAEENSRLAQKRYEAGVGTTLEVSDAQVALDKARTDELNARYDFFLAGIKLKKALGLYNEMLGQGADSK